MADHVAAASDDMTRERNIEAQSAFASTLVHDVEKAHPKEVPADRPHTNVYGSAIDTAPSQAGTDAVYAAKAALLNQALMDMGMGLYQWILFIITSVGWFLDSFWLMSFTIIAPSSANEAQFFYSDNKEAYLFISLYVGLTTGATAWPWMSDMLGRKWMFTSTLVLMGMGGLVGAGMPAFTGLCVVGFVVGFAVAGNQAVDAMILLESVPASHQFLVSMQGAFWGLGQLVASAVGWAFIAEYTCGTGPDEVSTGTALAHQSRATSSSSCHYVSNKGWRYVWWTFGCMTLFLYLCRFAFPLRETPKYLLSKRRDAEATQIVKDIAAYSNRKTWLEESSFARIDSTVDASAPESRRQSRSKSLVSSAGAIGVAVLCLLWAVTGLTFVLHKTYISKYLATKGVSAVTATSVTTAYLYSRYLYVALCAIPGPIIVGLLIEAKGLGRKRTGAIIAVLTGLFMFLATVSRSRNALLGFECILSFLQTATLAVLTTYTVEVFATPCRGFGLGVMGLSWGMFGLIASIVTTFEGSAADGAAVWFCGAIWVVMGGAWMVVPETRGRAAA
ncbi:MFS general substrate transporter [Aspergillus sclerotioniger CBS 115572]|uniref:MFS general substrate transporter n=1 Tax=Aspergillus sclerotioniger CBS 115572 TaxID=1450535 RepID=A0A317W460_9EURO|nr:MFS general substrate transporter [Aspergillus sclerotioniger CBS 115572]PWY80749.1 MFS general substrate transporter [Aspergillus sclerotioniger CBS 115572]